jgi:CxxC-x17-CxxC domain-containing protein
MSYPHEHENEVTYFARTNFRNQMRKFGVKTDDRRRHVYVIGKTGMGKTVLLENMFLSDVYAGHGCCYVDPHGDTAERLIDFIPSWRINDVIYFNPADLDYPIGFNILETVNDRHKHLVASGMMGVFKKIWENLWSARMEYILNNSILALLDNPGSTLLGINRMLSDAEFRKKIVANVQDPIVKQFWLVEFASYQEKYAQEAVAPIQNKIGQFLSASVIRNIVAQVKSTINIRQLMDQEKIFIVNLSKGRIGEDNMRLLGGLLITKMQLSAMERVDIPEHERKDFYMYVDEFQNFAVESFASILSEARKYRLCLTMAHQYIAQLSDEVREAVFGNVGTTITFRVGSPDATYMETEFAPRFTPEDIINLPKYNIYLKLLIDGVTSHPFSAMTLPPIAKRTDSFEKVIRVSRERYTTPRADIAEKIVKWTGMGDEATIALKVAEMEAKKKADKAAKKPRFEYKCSRCGKDIVLPVQLDTSRPIYCEECIELVRDERKAGKDRKFERRAPVPPPPPLRPAVASTGTAVPYAAPSAPTRFVPHATTAAADPTKPRAPLVAPSTVSAPLVSTASTASTAASVPPAVSTVHTASAATAHVSATSVVPASQPATTTPAGDDFLSRVLHAAESVAPPRPAAPARPSPVVSTVPVQRFAPRPGFASAGALSPVGEEKKRRRRRKKPNAVGVTPSISRPAMPSAPPMRPTPPPIPPSNDGFVPLKPHAPPSGTAQSGQTIRFD